MRLTRIRLRNYRVYADELDLEIPAGLVGIYGANGAGKSALVEAIRFSLYGRSRTSLDEVRTTGVGGEALAEVEFEHEGHLYVVRRTISGINHTVKAEAHWNGQQVAEGARDVATYVQSVIGMDDTAFRASVFAEQKQVAAFSGQTPQKRRDLVLRLLGITPLDKAREAARADARNARADHERLQARLPDVEALQAALAAAQARADEAEGAATVAEGTAAEGRTALEVAEARFEQVDDLRRLHEELVADGRGVRDALDTAEERVTSLTTELADLAEAADRLAELAPAVERLPELDERLGLLRAVAEAEVALQRIPELVEPPTPDDAPVAAARDSARTAAETVAEAAARLAGAEAGLVRASEAAERTAQLAGEGDCPVCGQELGESFEQAQAHRAQEVAVAETSVADQRAALSAARAAAADAELALAGAETALKEAQAARSAYDVAAERRAAALERVAEAIAAAGREPEEGELVALATELAVCQAAAAESQRLAGRLERRAAVEEQLEVARLRVVESTERRQVLLDKVTSLSFAPDDLAAARTARDDERARSRAADDAANAARIGAVQARGAAETAATTLEAGREQHRSIADLADTSRHIGRLADLLSDFRNQVVQTVGPRLAAHAADLFAELTDNEYDRLEVDPETYELQIRDAGILHGIDRFSGSETDLANLALRVAISEHVRFQSGGAVGLLVLDEVFGPLDSDRKERMLLALERLRGRFRQVLVVTHDAEIKEQLPSAIEVIKLPGRRATARVLSGV
ncbi:MAG TPA: SMC family ATPase [Acidimicrobiales bacterium]|nr:SMC family ATPase [Acidimicrobiales bacterium]